MRLAPKRFLARVIYWDQGGKGAMPWTRKKEAKEGQKKSTAELWTIASLSNNTRPVAPEDLIQRQGHGYLGCSPPSDRYLLTTMYLASTHQCSCLSLYVCSSHSSVPRPTPSRYHWNIRHTSNRLDALYTPDTTTFISISRALHYVSTLRHWDLADLLLHLNV